MSYPVYRPLAETITEAGRAAETKYGLGFAQVMALGVIAAAYLALATTLALAIGATITSPSIQKLAQEPCFRWA